MPERLYTTGDAADLACVRKQTIAAWTRDGKLRLAYVTVKGWPLYTFEAILDAMGRSTQAGVKLRLAALYAADLPDWARLDRS